MTQPPGELSLYDKYKLRSPNLGFRFDAILTEEGASIFGAHLRADKTRHLSRVLGGLAYWRSERPLESAVMVVEADTSGERVNDNSIILAQAAQGVIDHLVGIGAAMPDCVTYLEIEGVPTHEARLINGSYVSVQFSEGARVMLSPSSLADVK